MWEKAKGARMAERGEGRGGRDNSERMKCKSRNEGNVAEN